MDSGAPAQDNRQRNIIIAVIVGVGLLCCCCLFLAALAAVPWNDLLRQLSHALPATLLI